jgi:hypothetical protein
LSLSAIHAFAQTEAAEKKPLTTEEIAGKTFAYLDGSWGWHAMYFRPDMTFKVCGPVRVGCDEGTWSFENGKVIRVYKTWFATRNHRPTHLVLTINDKKGTFGLLSAQVHTLTDEIPHWVDIGTDPRK